MSPIPFLDDLVREYLLFRGFVNTLKLFDADVKAEKDKGLRSDKVVEQILSLISTHDLQGLRDLWQHLNSRLFRRLDPIQTGAVGRLEAGVLKLYVVNCVQNKNPEKVKEFFEKMSPELQGQADWKEWFAIPFLPNPESNPTFINYFSRHWQDTLMLTLHNFLAIVFASLPPPKLADYHATSSKIKRLREENDAMRQTLLKHHYDKVEKLPPLDIPRPTDVMDDFYIIASHELHTSNTAATENHAKGLKGFLRNFTGSSSTPLGTSVGSNTSAASKAEKSRSSSRSRTPRNPQENTGTPRNSQEPNRHAPVKRVSVSKMTSNLSSSLCGSTKNLAELDSSGENVKSKGDQRLAYLLLGQEEYDEHHSEVTQCRFSHSGTTIASSDVDGVVKVWSASPGPPHTYATFVSQSGISALDWFPNSDRKFIYGTMTGNVRICDKDERKAACDFNLNENSANSFVNQIVCSSTGNLCAIAHTCESADSLMVYDIKASKPIEVNLTQSLNKGLGTNSTVTSCVFNHNAQMIITGNTDGKVRIFDLRKRDCISSWSLKGATSDTASSILTLQMSSDETSIYTLSSDGQFSAWSFIQTSQKLFEVQLNDPYFSSDSYPRAAWGKQFAFAGDGRHLLVCSSNGGVIYEMDDSDMTSFYGEQSSSNAAIQQNSNLVKVLGLKGHKRHATCTDWSASNDCGPCVTAGFDGQIRISTLLSQ